MKRILVGPAVSLALGLAVATPAVAECLDDRSFYGAGEIRTQGGGSYSYGLTVGGPAVMRGTLTGGPGGLRAETFDLVAGYHIDFAGAGLARLLARDAASAEAAGTDLFVAFSPRGKLPLAVPGKTWNGKMTARVYAHAKGDANRRTIGEAKLDASYSFLAEMRADISGCSYRIIPVELKLTWQGETALQRRILFFPDLGVSAITIWGPDADGPQAKTGITGMGSGN